MGGGLAGKRVCTAPLAILGADGDAEGRSTCSIARGEMAMTGREVTGWSVSASRRDMVGAALAGGVVSRLLGVGGGGWYREGECQVGG